MQHGVLPCRSRLVGPSAVGPPACRLLPSTLGIPIFRRCTQSPNSCGSRCHRHARTLPGSRLSALRRCRVDTAYRSAYWQCCLEGPHLRPETRGDDDCFPTFSRSCCGKWWDFSLQTPPKGRSGLPRINSTHCIKVAHSYSANTHHLQRFPPLFQLTYFRVTATAFQTSSNHARLRASFDGQRRGPRLLVTPSAQSDPRQPAESMVGSHKAKRQPASLTVTDTKPEIRRKDANGYQHVRT